MVIELNYFTGTGNSLKVLDTCREYFSKSGHSTNLSEITDDVITIPEADIVGFCFPVYAFGIPRLCSRYLKKIQFANKQQKVFILVTAGDSDESGFAIETCEQILNKKNCNLIYSAVIQMPVNWTTAPKPPFPPSQEESVEIITKAVEHTSQIATNILKGVKKQHSFNYPKRYSKLKFYWDYWMFKHLGVQNMWRLFRVYDSCTGCGLCAKLCPTNSIQIVDHTPVWSNSCEQCMRCVNFCPTQAIYQTQGGSTKGKNQYHEPDFNPKPRTNRSSTVSS